MANFNHEENDKFAERPNQNYPGAWKRIRRLQTDILLRLPPGTYLLQNTRSIQTKMALTKILYPELLKQRLHLEYFLPGDRAAEIEDLAMISDFMGKINAKIEQLVGMPNGGNDPGLQELSMRLGGLIAGYYDSYIEVPHDHVWENNRECMGIVIHQPEPGLLYSKEVTVVNRGGRKLTCSPTTIKQLTSPIVPNKVRESAVKLHRLESFIPKRQMDAHWNRWNSANKQQKKEKMPECSVKLQRLETLIRKKQMKAYWKRYGDSVRQQKKDDGGKRKR